ncbi:MAG: acetyl-CoA carboxylase biotin carboxyl carrier protein subunit [Candidatus Delongbacteria bacterium]|jgi:biotin carboxyl carrier protein|nr:acetyl-CoA carboxylase biotin carboxyl carrier protein subunit [Candidatus Delongbacteria bacterium]
MQWNANMEKEIRAIIPGTIQEILVKPGDIVKAGHPVLVLEAMKMRNRIPAEFDGEVKKVLVKTGDKVPKNTLMVELK